MNWTSSPTSNNYFDHLEVTTDIANTTSFDTEWSIQWDSLIDWLPNSCRYTKYIPTWHLVKSYPKHKCEEAWFDEDQVIYDWYCKYCGKEMCW